jgi:hypothetical protein
VSQSTTISSLKRSGTRWPAHSTEWTRQFSRALAAFSVRIHIPSLTPLAPCIPASSTRQDMTVLHAGQVCIFEFKVVHTVTTG